LIKQNILIVATQSADQKLLKIYSEIIALIAKEYLHKVWPELIPVRFLILTRKDVDEHFRLDSRCNSNRIRLQHHKEDLQEISHNAALRRSLHRDKLHGEGVL
jgi:hypothetical protein